MYYGLRGLPSLSGYDLLQKTGDHVGLAIAESCDYAPPHGRGTRASLLAAPRLSLAAMQSLLTCEMVSPWLATPSRPTTAEPDQSQLCSKEDKMAYFGIVGYATETEALLYRNAAQAGIPGAPLITILNTLGLTTELKLCLDAGDIASYPGGAEQTWTDRSGNGFNFFRGSSSGAQSSDPTFNGTAGACSENEYWSFDGGDFFQETAAHGFDDNWHKNNGAFTIVVLARTVPAAGHQAFFSNNDFLSAQDGMHFYQTSLHHLSLFLGNQSGSDLNLTTAATVAPWDQWHFLAVAIDEAVGANGATLQIGSTQESFTSTHPAPSASNPDGSLRLGSDSVGGAAMVTGARLGCIAAWNRRLSNAELNSLRHHIGQRYGA